MLDLIRELLPFNRSITGEGLRQSLCTIGRHIPLKLSEVPTGKRVFDWTIPREWNLRDAWIKDAAGEKIVDLSNSFLHVVGYSTPVRGTFTLAELRPRLFTLPNQPDLIPYRTSYYNETWGFCLSESQLQRMGPGPFEVLIDADLTDGALTYGECLIKGQSTDEVLISTHCCHPSMCNDNLSGMSVATALAEWLQSQSLRYSYRFVFVPGTIGAIAWLAKNEAKATNIVAGLTLALLGGPGRIHYKKSRIGNAAIDRCVARVLQDADVPHEIREFAPYGYDERQYCSPGFNLPVGCFSRTPYGEFAEYHTSADDLQFISEALLADALTYLKAVVGVLEVNGIYRNLNPKCEPQLGKRGLYATLGGNPDPKTAQLAMLWILNFSDGMNDLLQIADRSGLSMEAIATAAKALVDSGLLKRESTEEQLRLE